jgi:predicted exporter
VLGFSRIPVIHSLGVTVALIVMTTLAVVELEPLLRRPAQRSSATGRPSSADDEFNR